MQSNDQLTAEEAFNQVHQERSECKNKRMEKIQVKT